MRISRTALHGSSIYSTIIMIAMLLFLTGCGSKIPLYLPNNITTNSDDSNTSTPTQSQSSQSATISVQMKGI